MKTIKDNLKTKKIDNKLITVFKQLKTNDPGTISFILGITYRIGICLAILNSHNSTDFKILSKSLSEIKNNSKSSKEILPIIKEIYPIMKKDGWITKTGRVSKEARKISEQYKEFVVKS